MGSPAAKKGDTDSACTIGCCTYTTYSINEVPEKSVKFNGLDPITENDVIDTATPYTWNCAPAAPSCPPLTRKIIVSSSTVYVNGKRVATINDKTHPQRNITGSGHQNIRIG